MVKSDLVGYVRASKDAKYLKIIISADAFDSAKRYLSQDGKEYVQLIANGAKIQEIFDNTRDVTSVMQIVDDE